MGYKVGLVGESNYQDTIRGCRPGQRAAVLHELGNPYDRDALVVTVGRGAKLGYIPKSSWLRDAVHVEDQGCKATIASINSGEDGALGVVIEVELDRMGYIDQCDYRP